MVASEMLILWKTKLSSTLQDQEFMCPPINLIPKVAAVVAVAVMAAAAGAVVLLLLWEMGMPFD
jgi:hypothetical protein